MELEPENHKNRWKEMKLEGTWEKELYSIYQKINNRPRVDINLEVN